MEEQSNATQSYAFTPDAHEVGYQSIPDRLRDIAKQYPDREAIVFLTTTGKRNVIKYQELYEI
jgi:acyl-CoA synthetase (AMP-forming)/AMP-acid ligase II